MARSSAHRTAPSVSRANRSSRNGRARRSAMRPSSGFAVMPLNPSDPPHLCPRTSADAGTATFEPLHGRRILEMRPAGAGAKGQAVARLLNEVRPAGVIVLGDDRSDAEAFAKVAAARDEGRVTGALAVAVHAADEAPPEVAAAADLVLASPREASRLLAILASELERSWGRAVTRRASPGALPTG